MEQAPNCVARPLGISIVGGLMLSQVLTLYTTPVVYLYMDRLRLAVSTPQTQSRARGFLPNAFPYGFSHRLTVTVITWCRLCRREKEIPIDPLPRPYNSTSCREPKRIWKLRSSFASET